MIYKYTNIYCTGKLPAGYICFSLHVKDIPRERKSKQKIETGDRTNLVRDRLQLERQKLTKGYCRNKNKIKRVQDKSRRNVVGERERSEGNKIETNVQTKNEKSGGMWKRRQRDKERERETEKITEGEREREKESHGETLQSSQLLY